MDSSLLTRLVDGHVHSAHAETVGPMPTFRSGVGRNPRRPGEDTGAMQPYFEPLIDGGAQDFEDVFGALIATVPRHPAGAVEPHANLGALDVHSSSEQRPFCIRAASSAGQRSSASVLVSKMYSWRGYQTSQTPDAPTTDRLTLVASDHDHSTVGTITIGFDHPGGLMVDDLFVDEVDALRQQGLRVCEFTKLAIDGVIRSKRLLASMFHVAYLFAHRVEHCDRLLIEVNPRHVRYYEKVLGFTVIGPQRLNRRVNAPAVLLCLELSHAREQIRRLAGLAEQASGEKSLYPFFFSATEEAGILARILSARQ